MKTSILKTGILALALTIGASSCSNDDNDFDGPSIVLDAPITVPFLAINDAGEMPSAADQPIYEIRTQNPVTAPDGHHITWGEFSTVQGTAAIECVENGVTVELQLTGLIPNGVYTIWNAVFDENGLDPTDPMLGIDGLGAAGKGDGSDNAFTASADGKASIEFTSPGGALSMLQNLEMETCPLSDQIEWHIVGAYHMDGNTYGPLLGPDGTVIEQFGFIYKNEIN